MSKVACEIKCDSKRRVAKFVSREGRLDTQCVPDRGRIEVGLDEAGGIMAEPSQEIAVWDLRLFLSAGFNVVTL